ncbi:MAG: sigma-70 family RNA polymerase sigma factor [Propionibacteriaceae bacterium]|jgi:RNA polymerase sigma-70 factor (ECF subfamily)|nr:sigma-70 family RNA polymerase sigma factor [Propionibacteriaceae bacterium]
MAMLTTTHTANDVSWLKEEYMGEQPITTTPLESPPPATDTDEVIARYQKMVYAISLTHTPSRPDADDVFQEVFLTYHRKNPSCNDEEHRKAWLITTTLTIAKRVSTSSWRVRVVPLTSDIEESSFTFRTDEQNALFAALAKIPETYRTPLHLFYFDDLSVATIAQVLTLETGAVKMRLSRGRSLMREILEESHD